jgi:hypothetical protein
MQFPNLHFNIQNIARGFNHGTQCISTMHIHDLISAAMSPWLKPRAIFKMQFSNLHFNIQNIARGFNHGIAM